MAANIFLLDTIPSTKPTVWKPELESEECVPPVANFTVSLTTPSANSEIIFTDTSTGNPMTSWAWDFGDGETSTLQNPTHAYVDPGTYTVTLAATNECGVDFEVKVDYIIVSSDLLYFEIKLNDFSSSNNDTFYIQIIAVDLSWDCYIAYSGYNASTNEPRFQGIPFLPLSNTDDILQIYIKLSTGEV